MDVPLVVCLHSEAAPKLHRRYAHPRCYEKQMGLAKLLTLAEKELGSIRICDVSPKTMRLIVKRRAS